MISPENAYALHKRMLDAALVPIDSADSPVDLSDHEYDQLRDAVSDKLAEAIEATLRRTD